MSYESINSVFLKGKSLSEFGIENYGFSRSQALSAVKLITEKDGVVFGGDVYSIQNGKLIPTYDNWFCERKKKESFQAFSLRAEKISLQFVQNYRSGGVEVLFVLIYDKN